MIFVGPRGSSSEMPEFRLMTTSDTPGALVYNLERRLTSIQGVFPFNVHPEPIELPVSGLQRFRSAELEAIALELCRARYQGEIPILITTHEIDEGGFSSFDDTVAVISIYHWSRAGFSPWPYERFLLFTIADVLMNIYVDTPVHKKGRCCIGDECDDEQDVNACLEACAYCSECKRLISSALGRGDIGPRRLAAIHRILDSAADRRRAFILMPFAPKFNTIYESVKGAVREASWYCARADNIVHTRDILTVIYEEIERCDLVIADLTGSNPNVYYELGYAHASGRNTILLTQDLRKLPFDLRQRLVIEYRPTSRGQRVLVDALQPHLAV